MPLELVFKDANINVAEWQGQQPGAKILQIVDPTGIMVVVPLPPEVAKAMAQALGSAGLVIANGPLPPRVRQ